MIQTTTNQYIINILAFLVIYAIIYGGISLIHSMAKKDCEEYEKIDMNELFEDKEK